MDTANRVRTKWVVISNLDKFVSLNFNFTDCGGFSTTIKNGYLANYSETFVLNGGSLQGYPQTLEYACNQGYDVKSQTTLTCNGSTGNFEPALTECIPS